jgi:hypothetical protein
MIDNLTLILAEFEKYKGQFVIIDFDWKVERLVAIGDDEQDYYYITYNGIDLKWHSCVGRIIPLKGYLRDEDYNEIVRITKLNDYDQVDLEMNGNMNNFLKSMDDYIVIEYNSKHKFLTEFCWDLKFVDIKEIRKRKIKNINENC